MADRGIIFSAPMVRALLDGRKTQTRRLLAGAPNGQGWYCDPADTPSGYRFVAEGGTPSLPCVLSYAPGDRLYVREAHRLTDCPCPEACRGPGHVYYEADGEGYQSVFRNRLRPSIHMPRWTSRLWLAVSDVRVQRLGHMMESDAIAEGVYNERHEGWTATGSDWFASPKIAFHHLWNSLHTDEGTRWEDNPWIYAVTFKVNHGSIDAGAAA